MSHSDIFLLNLDQTVISYCKKCNVYLEDVFDQCPFCYSKDLEERTLLKRKK